MLAEGTGVSRRPPRALVVDPDETHRATVADALRADGFLVRSAADGAAALVAIDASTPDVIISELTMPRLDGRALLEAMASRPETATIPMMFLTGDADLADRVGLLDAGADDVLDKTIPDEELVARTRARARTAEALARLRTQSEVDPLTGTLNRRGLRRALDREIEQSRRSRASLSLLLIDIDRFKEINDRFGHLAGDDVLRAIADTLTEAVRGGDVVARLGGDEFVLVLPDAGAEASAEVADRIREQVGKIRVADSDHRISLSIGTVIEPAGARGVELLLDAADRAMYRNKAGVSRDAT